MVLYMAGEIGVDPETTYERTGQSIRSFCCFDHDEIFSSMNKYKRAGGREREQTEM